MFLLRPSEKKHRVNPGAYVRTITVELESSARSCGARGGGLVAELCDVLTRNYISRSKVTIRSRESVIIIIIIIREGLFLLNSRARACSGNYFDLPELA